MQGKIRLPLKSQFEAADLPNPGRVVTSAKNMRNVFGLRLTYTGSSKRQTGILGASVRSE